MPRISINVVASGSALDQEIVNLDLPPGLSIGDLKGLVQAETHFAPDTQQFYLNNRPIRDDRQTIEAVGIKDGDMLAMVYRPPQAQQPNMSQQTQRRGRPPTDAPSIEASRQTMLNSPAAMAQIRQQQPALFDAIHDSDRFRDVWLEMVQGDEQRERQRQDELAMLNRDEVNVEAQMKIEEMIRQEKVMENLQFAYEHSPEVFGRVHMLYVPVTVNKYPVKAFVDSGAQTTIMSPSCAESCGIMRLIDKRYSGIAKGVGTAQILGRVHAADIKIGASTMSCSFTVMEGKDVDLLLGLDMLKRFQAIIDLKQNKLIFGDNNEVAFLGEADIPKYLDDAQQNEPTLSGPDGTEIGAKTGTVKPAGTSAAAASSSTTNGTAFVGKGNTLGSSSALSSSTAPTQRAPAPAPAPAPAAASPTHSKEKIETLKGLGFTEQQAIQALDACDGNVDYAAGLLFGN